MRNLLLVYGAPKEKIKTMAEFYGYAVMLKGVCQQLFQKSLANSLKNLGPAFAHKQFKFYFNDRGTPVAMVSWAMLSPEVEKRFLSEEEPQLHPSEWNEGSSLWIVDFVAPYGNLKYILLDLRDAVFRHHTSVTYSRRVRGQIVTKKMDRDCNAFFFKDAGPKSF